MIICLVGDPYKSSLATVTGGGTTQIINAILQKVNISFATVVFQNAHSTWNLRSTSTTSPLYSSLIPSTWQQIRQISQGQILDLAKSANGAFNKWNFETQHRDLELHLALALCEEKNYRLNLNINNVNINNLNLNNNHKHNLNLNHQPPTSTRSPGIVSTS